MDSSPPQPPLPVHPDALFPPSLLTPTKAMLMLTSPTPAPGGNRNLRSWSEGWGHPFKPLPARSSAAEAGTGEAAPGTPGHAACSGQASDLSIGWSRV